MHRYAIAHFAYNNAIDDKEHQSCIVSGESGAGKTVACKYLMSYLAVLSSKRAAGQGGSRGAQQVGVEEKVIACSPFLEAFGNACTPMNDNSSRFGKFLKIFFDNGVMVGGKMEHYLLEKARVAKQGVDSRNFHIFYFLVKGASPQLRKELGLVDDVLQFDIIKGLPTIKTKVRSLNLLRHRAMQQCAEP